MKTDAGGLHVSVNGMHICKAVIVETSQPRNITHLVADCIEMTSINNVSQPAKFHIPQEQVTLLLGPQGYINILFVIPVEEIRDFGIPFVRSQMDESGRQQQWENFWRYFDTTWCKSYEPSDWNLHAITTRVDAEDILINRTNNPLERFNRRMNDSFPNPHPNMASFVETIKSISHEYLADYEHIRKGRKRTGVHPSPVIPEIASEYYAFVRNCRRRSID